MKSSRFNSRPAFTLVEMLVVITIIGILVALLIPTIAGVVRRTRTAAVAVELQDLSRAVEAYKSKNNDYPPDFTSNTAVSAHIARAFQRNTTNVTTWLANAVPIDGVAGKIPANLDPAEAIVLWLSLLSTNPRSPLSGVPNAYSGERAVYFQFDDTRFGDIDNDGWREYYPKHGSERPFVYFDGRVVGGIYAYGRLSASPLTPICRWPDPGPNQAAPAFTDYVRPMRSNTVIVASRDNGRTSPAPAPITPTSSTDNTTWLSPGGFQILCAGLDNNFGTYSAVSFFKQFPQPSVEQPLSTDDEDNLANFSEMKTFADAVP